MSVILERWQAGVLAGSVLVAGVAVAGGAFLGGYALGDSPAPPPPTELAEKTYRVEDLEAALSACKLEDVPLEGQSVTVSGDHPPTSRQCFVAEMGASELAIREYEWSSWGTTNPEHHLESGEYSWSNVRMVWKQTDEGRDVNITVQ